MWLALSMIIAVNGIVEMFGYRCDGNDSQEPMQTQVGQWFNKPKTYTQVDAEPDVKQVFQL